MTENIKHFGENQDDINSEIIKTLYQFAGILQIIVKTQEQTNDLLEKIIDLYNEPVRFK